MSVPDRASGSAFAHPTPPYARVPYARMLAWYAEWIDPMMRGLRAEAVGHLRLKPGARVLDVACGTGLCFPYLVEAVGAAGEVVGVDINPTLAAKARARVARHGWRNVDVIEAAAHLAPLDGMFHGLLLFAAHEVLTSPEALDHLLVHLTPDARVATFGARRVPPPLGAVVNPLLALASRRLLPCSPPIDERPWRALEARLDWLTVEPRWGGAMYLAWGAGGIGQNRRREYDRLTTAAPGT